MPPRRMPRTRSASGSGPPASPAAPRRARPARIHGSGVTRSPRPSTSAGPPARKNGTSDPRAAAVARRASPVELRAPRLERRVECRGRIAGAARQTRRHGDPLVDAGGERRRRPDAGPPGTHGSPRGRERAQDQVVVERTGVEPRRRGANPRVADGATATDSRSASASGPSPMQLVEPVVPAADDRERQVELGRSQPDHRCQAPERVPRSRTRWRQRPERLEQPDPLPHRQGLRPPVGRDGASSSARSMRSGATPVSCRRSTFRSIFRRSRKPAWTSRHRSSSIAGSRRSSSSYGSSTITADSTSGAGSKASRRHAEGDPDARVVLDEHAEVRQPAGRGGDPLRDLALDHQHQPARARGSAEEPMKRRRGHVVREIGDHVVGRLDEVDEVLVEGVAAINRSRPSSSSPAKRPCNADHPVVELDRGHPGARLEEPARQHAQPGPDLEHTLVGRRVGLREDAFEHVDIDQEVLRQPVPGSQPGLPQRPPDRQGVEPRSRGRRDVRDAAHAAVTSRRRRERAAATVSRRAPCPPAHRPRTARPRRRRSSRRCRYRAPAVGR